MGYMETGKGFEFTATAQNSGTLGLDASRQRHPGRGLWLGGSYSAPLGDGFGVITSGWYLIPFAVTSHQSYDFAGLGVGESHRQWRADSRWWHVDGLAAFGGLAGFSVLGGLRYDRQDSHFQDPKDDIGVGGLPGDEADFASSAWIPLVGCQYASVSAESNVVIRVVGSPTILGRATFKETFGALGIFRDELSGSYKRGAFVEVFGEFTRKVGNAEVGAFVRYNAASATGNVSYKSTGFGLAAVETDTFDLSVYRTSWTFGGKVGVSF